jgi:hypothetical protein
MFRLHIDIPIVLPDDVVNQQASAREHAREIMDRVLMIIADQCPGVTRVNYRLGNDEDRGTPNYLVINENGHCSNKKSRWER